MRLTRDRNYRTYVGSEEQYDLLAATQFNLLTALGLREWHTLLDIGCGSLRAGRLFISYLTEHCYFGIEPNQWLLDEGIKHHIGNDLVNIKKPTFSTDGNFTLTTFGQPFDYLLAQSIFSHASMAQIARCFSEAAKVMTSSSTFAATFYVGQQSHTGDEWTYPGIVTYKMDDMVKLADQAGLQVKRLKWMHPNEQTWIALTLSNSRVETPDFDDAKNLGAVLAELTRTRAQLKQIKSNPIIKLGLRVRRLLGLSSRKRNA